MWRGCLLLLAAWVWMLLLPLSDGAEVATVSHRPSVSSGAFDPSLPLPFRNQPSSSSSSSSAKNNDICPLASPSLEEDRKTERGEKEGEGEFGAQEMLFSWLVSLLPLCGVLFLLSSNFMLPNAENQFTEARSRGDFAAVHAMLKRPSFCSSLSPLIIRDAQEWLQPQLLFDDSSISV